MTRLITVLVTLTFILPYVGFAFEVQSYPGQGSAWGENVSFDWAGQTIVIPSDAARITSTYQGSSKKAVVYIQDLHCNYEVQSHIAEIIGRLADRHALRLVGVEGDSTPIDVSKTASIPHAKIKTNVAQYFLKRGRITGAEYQATQDPRLRLQGIETQSLYEANQAALLKFLNEESQGYCLDLRDALESLKRPIYNLALAKLDHQRDEFDYENMTLERYCDFLIGEARQHGIALDQYRVLNLYRMDQRLPMTPESDYDKLLADAEAVEARIRDKVYTSSEQRQLDYYLKQLRIIEAMLNISAHEKDLALYRAHPEAFALEPIMQFVETQSFRHALQPDLDPGVVKLGEYLREAARFYRVADQRSEAFVKNLLTRMETGQETLAALITGGFHTSHVEAALQRHGISYVAIKPRLSRTDAENPYFSLLRNHRSPLEELLAKNQNIFAPSTGYKNPLLRQYMETVKEIQAAAQFVIIDKMRGPALEAAMGKFRQADPQDDPAITLLPELSRSNLEDGILIANFSGTGWRVIIRPSATTDYSLQLAGETLASGDLMYQFITEEEFQKHQAKILGTEGKARTAGPLAISRFFTNAIQHTPAMAASLGALGIAVFAPSGWTGLTFSGLLNDTLRPVAPLAAAVARRSGLDRRLRSWLESWTRFQEALFTQQSSALTWIWGGTGVLLMGSVILPWILPALAASPMLPLAAAGLFVGASLALVRQDSAPVMLRLMANYLLVLLVISLAQQTGISLLALPGIQEQIVPVFALVGVAAVGPKAKIIPDFSSHARASQTATNVKLPTDAAHLTNDRVSKAMAWARETWGYDTQSPLGSSDFETDLITVLALADEEAVVEEFVATPERLALAGIAYHNGRLPFDLQKNEGEIVPTPKVIVLAKQFAEAEAMAAEVMQGKKSIAELASQWRHSQAHLARLIQTIAAGGKEFKLGEDNDLSPEELLPDFFSSRQIEAIKKLVDEHGVELTFVQPALGGTNQFFALESNRKAALWQGILSLAQKLGARQWAARDKELAQYIQTAALAGITVVSWQEIQALAQYEMKKRAAAEKKSNYARKKLINEKRKHIIGDLQPFLQNYLAERAPGLNRKKRIAQVSELLKRLLTDTAVEQFPDDFATDHARWAAYDELLRTSISKGAVSAWSVPAVYLNSLPGSPAHARVMQDAQQTLAELEAQCTPLRQLSVSILSSDPEKQLSEETGLIVTAANKTQQALDRLSAEIEQRAGKSKTEELRKFIVENTDPIREQLKRLSDDANKLRTQTTKTNYTELNSRLQEADRKLAEAIAQERALDQEKVSEAAFLLDVAQQEKEIRAIEKRIEESVTNNEYGKLAQKLKTEIEQTKSVLEKQRLLSVSLERLVGKGKMDLAKAIPIQQKVRDDAWETFQKLDKSQIEFVPDDKGKLMMRGKPGTNAEVFEKKYRMQKAFLEMLQALQTVETSQESEKNKHPEMETLLRLKEKVNMTKEKAAERSKIIREAELRVRMAQMSVDAIQEELNKLVQTFTVPIASPSTEIPTRADSPASIVYLILGWLRHAGQERNWGWTQQLTDKWVNRLGLAGGVIEALVLAGTIAMVPLASITPMGVMAWLVLIAAHYPLMRWGGLPGAEAKKRLIRQAGILLSYGALSYAIAFFDASSLWAVLPMTAHIVYDYLAIFRRDDTQIKAMNQAQKALGYMPGSRDSGQLKTSLNKILELKADDPALQQFISTPQRLAAAIVVYHKAYLELEQKLKFLQKEEEGNLRLQSSGPLTKDTLNKQVFALVDSHSTVEDIVHSIQEKKTDLKPFNLKIFELLENVHDVKTLVEEISQKKPVYDLILNQAVLDLLKEVADGEEIAQAVLQHDAVDEIARRFLSSQAYLAFLVKAAADHGAEALFFAKKHLEKPGRMMPGLLTPKQLRAVQYLIKNYNLNIAASRERDLPMLEQNTEEVRQQAVAAGLSVVEPGQPALPVTRQAAGPARPAPRSNRVRQALGRVAGFLSQNRYSLLLLATALVGQYLWGAEASLPLASMMVLENRRSGDPARVAEKKPFKPAKNLNPEQYALLEEVLDRDLNEFYWEVVAGAKKRDEILENKETIISKARQVDEKFAQALNDFILAFSRPAETREYRQELFELSAKLNQALYALGYMFYLAYDPAQKKTPWDFMRGQIRQARLHWTTTPAKDSFEVLFVKPLGTFVHDISAEPGTALGSRITAGKTVKGKDVYVFQIDKVNEAETEIHEVQHWQNTSQSIVNQAVDEELSAYLATLALSDNPNGFLKDKLKTSAEIYFGPQGKTLPHPEAAKNAIDQLFNAAVYGRHASEPDWKILLEKIAGIRKEKAGLQQAGKTNLTDYEIREMQAKANGILNLLQDDPDQLRELAVLASYQYFHRMPLQGSLAALWLQKYHGTQRLAEIVGETVLSNPEKRAILADPAQALRELIESIIAQGQNYETQKALNQSRKALADLLQTTSAEDLDTVLEYMEAYVQAREWVRMPARFVQVRDLLAASREPEVKELPADKLTAENRLARGENLTLAYAQLDQFTAIQRLYGSKIAEFLLNTTLNRVNEFLKERNPGNQVYLENPDQGTFSVVMDSSMQTAAAETALRQALRAVPGTAYRVVAFPAAEPGTAAYQTIQKLARKHQAMFEPQAPDGRLLVVVEASHARHLIKESLLKNLEARSMDVPGVGVFNDGYLWRPTFSAGVLNYEDYDQSAFNQNAQPAMQFQTMKTLSMAQVLWSSQVKGGRVERVGLETGISPAIRAVEAIDSPRQAAQALLAQQDRVIQRWFLEEAQNLKQDALAGSALNEMSRLFLRHESVIARMTVEELSAVFRALENYLDGKFSMAGIILLEKLVELWSEKYTQARQDKFMQDPVHLSLIKEIEKIIRPSQREKELKKLQSDLRGYLNKKYTYAQVQTGRIKNPYSLYEKLRLAGVEKIDRTAIQAHSLDVVGELVVIKDFTQVNTLLNELTVHLQKKGYVIAAVKGINLQVEKLISGEYQVEIGDQRKYTDLKIQLAPQRGLEYGAEIKFLTFREGRHQQNLSRPAYAVGKSGEIEERMKLITIGGPAETSKYYAARDLAERLGFQLLDIGLIYRAAAYIARNNKIDGTQLAPVLQFMQSLQLDQIVQGPKIMYQGRDIAKQLVDDSTLNGYFGPKAIKIVDEVVLKFMQAQIHGQKSVVVGLRPIEWFPNADASFYMDMSDVDRKKLAVASWAKSAARPGQLVIAPEEQTEGKIMRAMERALSMTVLENTSPMLEKLLENLTVPNTLVSTLALSSAITVLAGFPLWPVFGAGLAFASGKLISAAVLLSKKYGWLGLWPHLSEPVGAYDLRRRLVVDPVTNQPLGRLPWPVEAHERYAHPWAQNILAAVGLNRNNLTPGSWPDRITAALGEFLAQALDTVALPYAVVRGSGRPRLAARLLGAAYLLSGIGVIAGLVTTLPLAPVLAVLALALSSGLMAYWQAEPPVEAVALTKQSGDTLEDLRTAAKSPVVTQLAMDQTLGVQAQPDVMASPRRQSATQVRLQQGSTLLGRLIGASMQNRNLRRGVVSAVWMGVSVSLGGVAMAEAAVRTAGQYVNTWMPARALNYGLTQINLTSALGRRVMASAWFKPLLSSTPQTWPQAQGAAVAGLLRLAETSADTQFHRDVVTLLNQIGELSAEKVTVSIGEGPEPQRLVIPKFILEKPALFWRLKLLGPIYDRDQQPIDIMPRRRLSIGSAA